MWRPIIVCSTLLLLAAASSPSARPATAPPDSGETTPAPRAPRAPRTPRAPGDHMIFMASGGSWLGVSVADIGSDRAKELHMKEETGAEITSVNPESPASEAGLKKGDVILEYQETRVEGAMQITRMVRETPPGRTVTLRILRDGQDRAIKVKMTGQDSDDHERMSRRRIVIPPIEVPEIDIPDIPFLGSVPSSSRLGVSVENLGEQLGDYFGVKDGEGVLVRSVKKGSPADGAGLRAGDVIVKVDGEKISDSADLRSALREKRGRSFPLGIVRDRREQSVTVTLPRPEPPPEEDLEESERLQGAMDFGDLIREQVERKMEQARPYLEAAQAEIEAGLEEAQDDI